MPNTFNLTFGKEPNNIILSNDMDEIINNFTIDNPHFYAYLITGVRGSGKTVMLSRLKNIFSKMDDFIVIELSAQSDMLEQLAFKLYAKLNNSFKQFKKEFSFSFSGFTFKISGKEEMHDAVSLIDKLLDYISKKKKKLLILVDDVYNSKHMRIFTSHYQMFIRDNYSIFLIMTGLFENIRSVQDEKGLTFLYRTPIIFLKSLDVKSISLSYEALLNIDEYKADELARLTNGYAFAYQVLGYLYYEKRKIDEELLNKYDEYLRNYVYEKVYLELSDIEKNIVLSINSNDSIKVKEVLESAKISSSYFSMYRERLIKKGILTSDLYGKIKFSLPRFKEFLDRIKKSYIISSNSFIINENLRHLDFSGIELAKKDNLDRIKYICDTTINAIYPLYYPKGAVDFFINHHSKNNILKDIENNRVYVIKDNNEIIGTVTIKDNEINRLFVLHTYHKKGFGKRLIVFAEDYIFKRYDFIKLDASLPSKTLYLKIGYKEIEYNKIETDNGDYLCFDVMEKKK